MLKSSIQVESKETNQKSLEKLYMQGCMHQVNKQYKEAVQCFAKAAQAGYAIAQVALGKCFEKGIGVKKNMKHANNWYDSAAQQCPVVAQKKPDEPKQLEKQPSTQISIEQKNNNNFFQLLPVIRVPIVSVTQSTSVIPSTTSNSSNTFFANKKSQPQISSSTLPSVESLSFLKLPSPVVQPEPLPKDGRSMFANTHS